MSTPLMPELPKPARRMVEVCGQSFLTEPIPGMWSEHEVRAYGLAVWKAAMERAAEAAEETIVAEYEGVDCYGEKAASAIRSLPLPESDMTQARTEK